jgi:hypothetical protein
VPNDIPKDPWRCACSACGQEIRFGERDGRKGWHHREPVDHAPVLGHRVDMSGSNMLEAEPEPDDPLQSAEVEVWAHPVEPTEFAAQSGLRQMANLVSGETRLMPNGKTSKSKKHPPAAPGWELVNITHARGPYRGNNGKVLSVSDTHVLRARGPVGLDGSRRIAVGSWRDLAFDYAYVGVLSKSGRIDPLVRASSTEMKDWILGHDLPEPVQQPGE